MSSGGDGVDWLELRWPAVMDRREAARYLGISARTFSTLKSFGKVRAKRHYAGKQPRYLRTDLDAYIETMQDEEEPHR